MTKKHYSPIQLLLVALLLTAVPLFANVKEALTLKRTVEFINAYHYEPKTLDDAFSEQVFEAFLEEIDPNKQFLTQQDIAYLESFKRQLDDQIIKADPTFQKKVATLHDQRVKQVQGFYTNYFEEPMSFEERESLETDPDKRSYAVGSDELRDRWRRIIKENILTQYLSLAEKDKEASANIEVFVQRIEEEARELVKKNFDSYFANLNKETSEEKFAKYVDVVANVFDPHTGYYLPEKKEDFDISISGKLEGIGAVLKEEDGYIKVVRIVVGSASWRQKELEADDTILKVGQGADPPVNAVGMRVRDAVKLIRGKKGTEVRLTVKKPDESIKTIPIVRDVVHLEETYAKETVIHHEGIGAKVGYIYLPSFYRDFNDANARNSATDVKNAVAKLVSQDVMGIIIDLRNNGGGSLKDAVDMAGLFIPEGPVVQVRDSRSISTILRDKDASVQYEGPLVLLTNAYSASASEILAAALQDYGRAVILGAYTSYGKGTVQTFVDLDKSLPYPYREHRPLGSIKLTIQKFYRINGGSTQFKGVVPDIILPTPTDFRDIGEKELPHALEWSTVSPLQYTQSATALPLDKLRAKSRRRVKRIDAFKTYESYSEFQKERKEKSDRSLVFKDRIKTHLERKEKEKTVEEITVVIPELSIPTPNFSSKGEKLEQDQEKFRDWKASLEKDAYVNEAIYVLDDIQKLQKKGDN